MSETNDRPGPDASIRGDTKDLPNRGTTVGVDDTYGADLGCDATNGCGRITGDTKSDPALDDSPGDPPEPDDYM